MILRGIVTDLRGQWGRMSIPCMGMGSFFPERVIQRGALPRMGWVYCCVLRGLGVPM